MNELAEYVAQMVVVTAATFALVLSDERRLDPKRRARAWPRTTRLAACVLFAPLCIPIHFWRTRRTFLGVVIGLGWLALVLGAGVLAGEGAGALFG